VIRLVKAAFGKQEAGIGDMPEGRLKSSNLSVCHPALLSDVQTQRDCPATEQISI
jgi:hypothetical protein